MRIPIISQRSMKKQQSNMHKKSIEVTRNVDLFQNTDI